MCIPLDAQCPLFFSDFNENWFSRRIFEKYSYIIFHENPFRGSRVPPCGRKENTKLRVASRNFANAPKNHCKKMSTDPGIPPVLPHYTAACRCLENASEFDRINILKIRRPPIS
jgi:hypothetical protein